MEQINILIVEDDMIIAADISMILTEQGYDILGMAARGEMAVEMVKNNRPDLVLMDINLKGNWDGIESARRMQEVDTIPIIFLTGNTDQATFEKAKAVKPYAFIGKPFSPMDLVRAIELALSRIVEEPAPKPNFEATEQIYLLKDRIFIKHRDSLVKIPLDDIYYVTAESNYCRIVTESKEFVLAITLKAFEERLNISSFLRVHRSYFINLNKLDEVGDVYLQLGKHQIPFSKGYKEELLKRLTIT